MQHVDRLAAQDPQAILVVLPTWVGDSVMATPTLRALRNRFADARITFLMNPNLRELVSGGDWMDECVEWPPIGTRSASDGPRMIANCQLPIANSLPTPRLRLGFGYEAPRSYWGLVKALRARRFDLAILLPNSFRVAWIAWCSGAKRCIGYGRDGRSFLLTDRIPVRNRRGGKWSAKRALRTSIKMGTKLPVRLGRYVPMPLVEYYADLAEAIGCERPGDQLQLFTTPDCDEAIQRRLASVGIADRHPLIVISPGAKFGASKCWMPERFAAVGDRLIESENATVIVTCGPGEEAIARSIGGTMKNSRSIGPSPRPSDPPGPSLHGRLVQPSVGPSHPWKGEGAGGFVFDNPLLTLGELKSLIRRCDLLICNDAGPRHLAKAFDVPVVTVFGPTHPDWTSTSYQKERIVRVDVDCGPCQQRVCPLGHHQCMTGVTVDRVFDAATSLLQSHLSQHADPR